MPAPLLIAPLLLAARAAAPAILGNVARQAASRAAAVQIARATIARGAGANGARVLAGSTAARGAAAAGARGSLLGRAAVTYTAADILGGVLGSFFSGAKQGITGGFLGGDGDLARGGGGGSSLSSSAAISGAAGNFSGANKENCCCCKETLSLLGSIDRTLKIGLNVSKAQFDLDVSRNASERERISESGNQKTPGQGGLKERLEDSAEEVGFGIGKFILDAVSALLLVNAPQLLRGLGDMSNIVASTGAKPGPMVLGATGMSVGLAPDMFSPNMFEKLAAEQRQQRAGGMASGGLVSGPGGPRDDKIITRLSNGEFVVNANSTKANYTLLSQINNNPFSIAAQKQKETTQQAQIIGDIVSGSLIGSLERIFKNLSVGNVGNTNQKQNTYETPKQPSETPQNNLFSTNQKQNTYETPKQPSETPQNNLFSSIFNNNSNSLIDLIGKVESRGDPNVFRRGGEAVEGYDLQNMTIDEVLKLGGTAYGKHQFIPETLKMLASDLKLDTSKVKFTEAVQDKLANHQLMKINSVRTAMKDPSEQNISSAMTDISHVWRGLPDPRTGTTYQDKFAGGNKAGTSVDEFKNRFKEYLEGQRNSPVENMINDVLRKPAQLLGIGNASYAKTSVDGPKGQPKEGQRNSLFENVVGEVLRKPGQLLDQIALKREANESKQMASAAAPVIINNNQSGGQQQKMPAVMLPIDGPTLPFDMVTAVSQFSTSRYA